MTPQNHTNPVIPPSAPSLPFALSEVVRSTQHKSDQALMLD